MIKREELQNPKSCLNRAADDEMTFVLLGRDGCAPAAIMAWAMERVRLGMNTRDDAQIREAMACAVKIDEDLRSKAEAAIPLYRCHKEVKAAKIRKIIHKPEGGLLLCLEGIQTPISVDHRYGERNNVVVGGYYVKYEDGYESFSPADAFEGGYALVKD